MGHYKYDIIDNAGTFPALSFKDILRLLKSEGTTIGLIH